LRIRRERQARIFIAFGVYALEHFLEDGLALIQAVAVLLATK
jgi:hypothetical protein